VPALRPDKDQWGLRVRGHQAWGVIAVVTGAPMRLNRAGGDLWIHKGVSASLFDPLRGAAAEWSNGCTPDATFAVTSE
jgi:hypothetical protein